MSAPPAGIPTPARPPRLNPFRFPSNTDFLFALLVVAVLAVSLEIFDMLYLWDRNTGVEWARATLECVQKYNPAKSTASATQFEIATKQYSDCIAPIERKRSLTMLAGLLPLAGLAGLIYWFYPTWIIRRGGLVPLTRDDAPEVVDAAAALSREIGLARAPDLYWNPLDLSVGGMAFGRMGRYSVKMSGGLVSQFMDDQSRGTARAVMAHELSHIRSEDIDKTYLTIALWLAFLIVTLIPFAYNLFRSTPDVILDISWRIAVLALLVYLIRNMVLRSREFYADLRAYQVGPVRSSLKRMLTGLRVTHQRFPGQLFEVHPQPGKRLDVLYNPLPLFEQGFLTALATGLVAGIAYEPLLTFLSAINMHNGNLMAFLTGFVIAPLVVCIVGLGIWRSAFARLFDPRIPIRFGQVAFGLAVGAFLGRAASLTKLLVTMSGTFEPGRFINNLVIGILWVLLVGISLVFFFRWIALSASGWMRVALDRPSPGPYSLAGVLIGSIVLSAWFGAVFFMLYLGESLGGVIFAATFLTFGFGIMALPNPITLLVMVLLWAFPLAAVIVARRRVSSSGRVSGRVSGGSSGRGSENSGSSWAFLDSETAGIPVTASASGAWQVNFGGALVPAVTMGILYTGMTAILRLGLRVILPQAVRDQDGTKIAIFIGAIVLAILAQLIVAMWVTARAGRYRPSLGLLAAFACGCVQAVGFLVGNVILGGTVDLPFAWDAFSYIVNGGALVSIPFILLVNWVANRIEAGRTARDGQVSQVVP